MSHGPFLFVMWVLATETARCVNPSTTETRHSQIATSREKRQTCEATHFLYTVKDTCIQCPSPCSSCVPYTQQLEYACATCTVGHTFNLQPEDTWGPRSDPLGGSCVDCKDLGKVNADDSAKVLLNQPRSSTSMQYEGRLEVYYSKQWWAVCDDHWTMTNTDAACREMGLGRGVDYFSGYDRLYPDLQPIQIGFDEVKCETGSGSFFHCKHSDFGVYDCRPDETIGIRCSGPKHTPHCVDACYVGLYANVTSNTCIPCSLRCLGCDVRADNCTMCEHPDFLTEDGTCVEQCPDGFHGNHRTRTCEACHPNCSTCADGTSHDHCLTCNGTRVLHEGKACLETCPTGTYLMEGPVPMCLAACPEAFYSSSINTCLPCNQSCQACNKMATNCTRCSATNGRVLLQGEQPTPQSDLVYRCVDQCSQGFYSNARGVCTLCADPNCLQCYLGGVYCSTCSPGFKLQLSKCVTSCSDGLFDVDGVCQDSCHVEFYGDGVTGQCEHCGPRCRHCRSDDSTTCTSCSRDFYLKSGSCLADCGDGMMAVGSRSNDVVRLVGGLVLLDGRVEVFYQGSWGQLCADSWTLTEGEVVCKELGLGHALQISQDGRYGSSGQALGRRVECTTGQEASIWDCEHDVPTKFTDCQDQIAGVRCSGPDLSNQRLCLPRNPQTCDVTPFPCHPGVKCTDLAHGSGSYCGVCGRGMTGNGRNCEEIAGNFIDVIFPQTESTTLSDWPEGVELTLPCVAEHADTLLTSWWYGDVEMKSADETFRVAESGSLTLFHPTVSDSSGIYTCTLSNITHNVSIFYDLTVQKKVEIFQPPAAYTGSGQVMLDCGHEGSPTPTVSWYRDDQLIDTSGSGGLIEQADNGSLLIHETMSSHSGLYICEVSNGITSDQAEATVTVLGPAKIILKEETPKIAALGHNVSVPCVAAGSPTPSISWRKDGQTLRNTTHIQVGWDGSIRITSLTRAETGKYTCTAKNDQGPMDEWQIVLIGLVFPSASVSPEHVDISVGKDASFVCNALGDPPLEISWEIPGRGNFSESDDDRGVMMGNEFMTMFGAVESNTGYARCLVTSPVGTAAASAYISVRAPPRFLSSAENVTALEGWSLSIKVTVRSVPEAEFTWSRGNQKLTGDEYIVTSEAGFSNLTFIPEWPDSSGWYTLTAVNDLGKSSQQVFVKVLRWYDPPKIVDTQLTNVTITAPKQMHSVVSDPDLDLYEIWVCLAGDNETQEKIDVNPLELPNTGQLYNQTALLDDPMYRYIALVFNSIPERVVIGDGMWYESGEKGVYNAPLLPHQWYAVIMRIMRNNPSGEETMVPIGATKYQYFYTQTESADDDDMGTLVIAMVVVLALILLGITVLFLLHKKRLLRLPSLRRWWSNTGSMMDVDGRPIDVEGFLEQFSSDTTAHINYSQVWASSTASTSTLYIPTEDEIDKLEKIGIDYYLEETWLQRVPDGVLEVDSDVLQELKAKDRSNLRAGLHSSLIRSSSEPELPKRSSPLVGRSLSTEPVTEPPSEVTSPGDLTTDVITEAPSSENPRADQQDVDAKEGNEHRTLAETPSAISRNSSRQSDSGFESEYHPLPRRLSVTSKAGAALAREVVTVMRSNVGHSTPSTSSEERKKYKEKPRRGRGKKMSKLRERGAALLSNISRKMSMHVFDLDHGHKDEDDNYAADSSGESDTEFSSQRKAPPQVAARPRPVAEEEEELDMENAYIDPSTIVSVPKATNRLKELREHNNPIETSLLESAPKLFHMTQAIIHQRRSSSAVSMDEALGVAPLAPTPTAASRNPLPENSNQRSLTNETKNPTVTIESAPDSPSNENELTETPKEELHNDTSPEQSPSKEVTHGHATNEEKILNTSSAPVQDEMADGYISPVDSQDENKEKQTNERDEAERSAEEETSDADKETSESKNKATNHEAGVNTADGDQHIYLKLINAAPVDKFCPVCKVIHGETIPEESEKDQLDTPPALPPRTISLPPSPVASPKHQRNCELSRRFSFPAHQADSKKPSVRPPKVRSIGEEIRRLSVGDGSLLEAIGGSETNLSVAISNPDASDRDQSNRGCSSFEDGVPLSPGGEPVNSNHINNRQAAHDGPSESATNGSASSGGSTSNGDVLQNSTGTSGVGHASSTHTIGAASTTCSSTGGCSSNNSPPAGSSITGVSTNGNGHYCDGRPTGHHLPAPTDVHYSGDPLPPPLPPRNKKTLSGPSKDAAPSKDTAPSKPTGPATSTEDKDGEAEGRGLEDKEAERREAADRSHTASMMAEDDEDSVMKAMDEVITAMEMDGLDQLDDDNDNDETDDSVKSPEVNGSGVVSSTEHAVSGIVHKTDEAVKLPGKIGQKVFEPDVTSAEMASGIKDHSNQKQAREVHTPLRDDHSSGMATHSNVSEVSESIVSNAFEGSTNVPLKLTQPRKLVHPANHSESKMTPKIASKREELSVQTNGVLEESLVKPGKGRQKGSESNSVDSKRSVRKVAPVFNAASSKPRPKKLVIPGVFSG